MSRFRESLEDEQETGIDMSPLIDCVFILLIFFIVTTVFVEETGVDVNRPEAASSVNLDKTSILIAISDNGEVVYGGRNIGVAGVGPQIKRLYASGERLPVIIQGDTNANLGIFARVLDAAKAADAEKVSLATKQGR